MVRKHTKDSKDSQAISWAIAERKSDKLIGSAQLRLDESRKSARLSYWLGQPFWNKGFATEAAVEVVKFGFNTLELENITADHFLRNPASGKVLQNLGFQCIGRVETKEGLNGNLEVLILYVLTPRNF